MQRDKFNMIQCRASAKAILIGLGVKRSLIPSAYDDLDELAQKHIEEATNRLEKHPHSKEAIEARGKRFRRTRGEMEQVHALTEIQKEHRNGRVSNSEQV